jgi:hypothetical protein
MVTNTRSLLAFILVFNSHTSHYHLSLSLSIFSLSSLSHQLRVWDALSCKRALLCVKARDLSNKVKARATLALETSRATLALETSAHKAFTRRMFIFRLSHILALQPLKYETHTCFAADKKRHDERERHNDVCTYMFDIPIYMFAI